MNLVRNLKISKITSVEFTEIELEIVEFINSKLDDLIPFKNEKYPNSMFYMNSEGKWILQQNDKKDVLWVSYYGFWNVLESKYSMEYSDIQTLIKYMVEQAFKAKVSTPLSLSVSVPVEVEQCLMISIFSIYLLRVMFSLII